MNRPNDDLVKRIEDICQDDLNIPKPSLSAQTRLAEIKGLDSLGMINLFMAMESAFGVRFTTDEMAAVKSIGDITELISAKSNGSGGRQT
jgi:acyl carrier protein